MESLLIRQKLYSMHSRLNGMTPPSLYKQYADDDYSLSSFSSLQNSTSCDNLTMKRGNKERVVIFSFNSLKRFFLKNNNNMSYDVSSAQTSNSSQYEEPVSQKILITRHSERVDSYFGVNWLTDAFDEYGRYRRFNRNMPVVMVPRQNLSDFRFDPPLTENGLEKARLVGVELARNGILVTNMYSSPALRSIQTADKILEGMGLKYQVPIRIETGLFEVLSWQPQLPNKYPFINKNVLHALGYNIDLKYEPLLPFHHLMPDENEQDYYDRSHFIAKTITNRHHLDGKNIMMVGHAPSLEGCSRQLIGKRPRVHQFVDVVRKTPFLATVVCEKNPYTGRITLLPTPTMAHLGLEDYKWSMLQEDDISSKYRSFYKSTSQLWY